MPGVWQEGAGWAALLARLLAPFARRNAEPLLEDAAEMGEVVKTPREGDLADMPGLVGGVGEIALATLKPLRLHVSAERGLLGGHQIAGVTRRDSGRRRGARQRQFGIGEMRQDMVLEAIKKRRAVHRLVRQPRMQPVGQRHRKQVERMVE